MQISKESEFPPETAYSVFVCASIFNYKLSRYLTDCFKTKFLNKDRSHVVCILIPFQTIVNNKHQTMDPWRWNETPKPFVLQWTMVSEPLIFRKINTQSSEPTGTPLRPFLFPKQLIVYTQALYECNKIHIIHLIAAHVLPLQNHFVISSSEWGTTMDPDANTWANIFNWNNKMPLAGTSAIRLY